jgi:hypothetical protein
MTKRTLFIYKKIDPAILVSFVKDFVPKYGTDPYKLFRIRSAHELPNPIGYSKSISYEKTNKSKGGLYKQLSPSVLKFGTDMDFAFFYMNVTRKTQDHHPVTGTDKLRCVVCAPCKFLAHKTLDRHANNF